MTEYFAYPAKFFYLDVAGWDAVRAALGPVKQVEVVIFLDRSHPRLEQLLDPAMLRLGCTPAANLFEWTAEPIPLTHTRPEYKVVPEVGHPTGYEVFGVTQVTAAAPDGRDVEYQPFYHFRHGESRSDRHAFWYSTRRPGLEHDDRGTDVYLHLVDSGFDPTAATGETLVVRTLCTNRDLPTRLPRVGEEVRFHLGFAAPGVSVRSVRNPTGSLRPTSPRGRYWHLISHLNLNHLSLTDNESGTEALKAMLRLYDLNDLAAEPQQAALARQAIDGILNVTSHRTTGWVGAGRTRRIRARAGNRARIGRDEVRRRQRRAVRVGPRTVLRPLRVGELVHATRRALPPARRHPETLAAARGRQAGGVTFNPVFTPGSASLSSPGKPGLSNMPSPKDKLATEFFEFDFFQAVRVLEKLAPKRAPVGLDGAPGEEVARFRAHLSMAFPPSQIVALDPAGEERPNPLLTVTFLGLYGPSGVLPTHYTQLLMDIQRDVRGPERRSLRDWLDLFNHRFISLFYRAWEKYRFHLQYERGEAFRQGLRHVHPRFAERDGPRHTGSYPPAQRAKHGSREARPGVGRRERRTADTGANRRPRAFALRRVLRAAPA